jgi:hypothetical protein
VLLQEIGLHIGRGFTLGVSMTGASGCPTAAFHAVESGAPGADAVKEKWFLLVANVKATAWKRSVGRGFAGSVGD